MEVAGQCNCSTRLSHKTVSLKSLVQVWVIQEEQTQTCVIRVRGDRQGASGKIPGALFSSFHKERIW